MCGEGQRARARTSSCVGVPRGVQCRMMRVPRPWGGPSLSTPLKIRKPNIIWPAGRARAGSPPSRRCRWERWRRRRAVIHAAPPPASRSSHYSATSSLFVIVPAAARSAHHSHHRRQVQRLRLLPWRRDRRRLYSTPFHPIPLHAATQPPPPPSIPPPPPQPPTHPPPRLL